MNHNSRTSQRFLWICALLIWITLSNFANAQTVRFKAEVEKDGSIELVPIDAATASRTTTNTGETKAFDREEFFLVKDPAGVVKGVYADQATAMAHPLSPGDSVEVFAAAEEVVLGSFQGASNDIDDDMLDKVAKEAAKRLLATVKASACEFDPLPETVSPTVEVSFSLFAGTSLSIQATWITAKVCSN